MAAWQKEVSPSCRVVSLATRNEPTYGASSLLGVQGDAEGVPPVLGSVRRCFFGDEVLFQTLGFTFAQVHCALHASDDAGSASGEGTANVLRL